MKKEKQNKLCKLCKKKIKNKYNSQKYHKECALIMLKAKQREYHQRLKVKARMREYQQKYNQKPEIKAKRREYYQKRRERYKKRNLEYVKIPSPFGKQELIYADGDARDIQKQVPKLIKKACKRLLK